MKRWFKPFIALLSFILVFSVATASTSAATVNTKNSRVTFKLKDVSGKRYKVYIIGSNEKKAIGSIDAKYDWAFIWAGINEGDILYKGSYKIYIQKEGSKKISYTGYQMKNYIYNKTRKMIYWLPSKYKGQPDLLAIAETESSNGESANIYYVKSGKLKKTASIGYTVRPRFAGKNKLQIADYNNAVEVNPWRIDTYTFSPAKASFKRTNKKYYSFEKGGSIVHKWKKDWR
ncbi:hypothetical protein ACT8ZR_12040 [Neobacillus sp. M.A.Huq-85]